jgi:hypothetical protein
MTVETNIISNHPMIVSHYKQKEYYQTGWINDFLCGIHSDIPLCCVLFYCDVWYAKLSLEFDFRCENPIGYIMCPDCIVKFVENKIRPVRIKYCNCCD